MLLGTQLKMSGLHTSVVIPSYELETSSPFTFWHKHSSIASQKETGYIAMQRSEDCPGQNVFSCGGVRLVKGRDFKIWEVARASSAAPTYFPSRLPPPRAPPAPLPPLSPLVPPYVSIALLAFQTSMFGRSPCQSGNFALFPTKIWCPLPAPLP